jgi:glycerophosphoryl diester phosphodiesterase
MIFDLSRKKIVYGLVILFLNPLLSGLHGILLYALFLYAYRKLKLPQGPDPSPYLGHAVGHRGLREKRAPENSLLSLDLALTESVSVVEIDVHLAKDGELVVFHDVSLKRIIGKDKVVHDCTSTELWEDCRYAGFPEYKEGVPRLDKVLQLVLKKHQGKILIELKGVVVGWDYLQRITDRLVDTFKEWNCYDHAVVISFNPIALYLLRAKDPKIATCILYYPKHAQDYVNHPDEGAPLPSILKPFVYEVDKFVSWSCRTWLPEFLGASFVGPNHEEVSVTFINRWKRKNIGVYAWTLNVKHVSKHFRKHGAIIASDFFDEDTRKEEYEDKRLLN